MEATRIAACFADCFIAGSIYCDPTRMVMGGDEPLYLPPGRQQPVAEVVAARGLAQSCLHEAAHWLYAGRQRRRLTDYGYWYVPDGRNADQQRHFESMEARVQGLEWILSLCAGVRFHVSADNLTDPIPTSAFRCAIAADARARLANGLHPRAQRFAAALCQAAGLGWPQDDTMPDLAPL
jgi:elongation factor P hydroxylase